MDSWTSPDRKIKKEVLCQGIWGDKPLEGSECTINITDSPLLEQYVNTVVTIGDNDGDLWRALDICLTTMFVKEKSKFTITLNDSSISLVVELVDLVFNGFVHQYLRDANKMYHLALHHKEKGNEFFNKKNNKEAAFRFTKALKIMLLIPIEAGQYTISIDSIPIEDIIKLKAKLFNNLSSCYFRNQSWTMVINLCNKVFTYDPDNIKALYKIGVAYENDRNFEKAHEALSKVLNLDPENKACAEHLACVKEELKKAEIKVNNMMKKMFSAAIKN